MPPNYPVTALLCAFPRGVLNVKSEAVMENDKIQELLQARTQADQELEKMRTPITILFSDIKGSTPYFEKKGDVEGLAMIQRHNELVIPVIEKCGGRVVKTIGDAVMAAFREPVSAV